MERRSYEEEGRKQLPAQRAGPDMFRLAGIQKVSTVALRGEMIAVGFPSKLSKSPPIVATRSMSPTAMSRPNKLAVFDEAMANADALSTTSGASRCA